MVKKRILILLALMLALILTACGTNTAMKDGVIGGRPAGDSGISGRKEGMYAPDGIVSEAAYSAAEPGGIWGGGDAPNYQPGPGMMTGAEQRDTDDLAKWKNRFQDEGWTKYNQERGLYAHNVIAVKAVSNGNPVFNFAVALCDAQGQKLYEARTDLFGKAYLFFPNANKGETLTVKNGNTTLQTVEPGKDTVEVDVQKAGDAVKALDLMLMVDTTGSMGDELEFLKSELADMVKRVAAGSGQALSIRTSVNFYRDEGDEYVVKYYDFRDDVEEAVSLIKQQFADGGGDYPEAVHTALDNAVNQHDWRDNAVKLCFLVLDAPPHDESDVQGVNASLLKSLRDAAQKGIKIIPVSASGIDEATECLLRSFAVMTGGTYVFITDDSGIGNPHLPPKVEEYTVEPLNECMIRIVCEFCGAHYEAPETDPTPTPQNQTEPAETGPEPTDVLEIG